MLIVALLLQILSQYAIVSVMYYRFGAFSGCEWFIHVIYVILTS
jgi:hypothetical protein